MNNILARGTLKRIIYSYTFSGTEPAGTEIITGDLIRESCKVLSVRKVSQAGIASTSANFGYRVTEGSAASNATYFASAASLAAGTTTVVDLTATGDIPEPPYLPWRLSVVTTTAAVAGNAGLTVRVEVTYMQP